MYTPFYVTGVSQQTEVSCGAFASGFVVSCVQHKCPSQIRFACDQDMRTHLSQCLDTNTFTMIPSNSRTSDTSILNPPNSFIRTLGEIERQKQLQNKKNEARNSEAILEFDWQLCVSNKPLHRNILECG